MGRIAAIMMALMSAGCSYLGTAEDFDPAELDREDGWVTVKGVPVVRQEQDEDCGAAALAMALQYWSVPTSLEDVARECPPVPKDGIKAGALRECARSHGLQSFLFHGTFTDFEKELSRGRPVIVGLIKPYVNGGLSHFEVVVGLNPRKELVVTLDPANGWRRNSYEGFLMEWEPAKRLTLVLLKPSPDPGSR